MMQARRRSPCLHTGDRSTVAVRHDLVVGTIASTVAITGSTSETFSLYVMASSMPMASGAEQCFGTWANLPARPMRAAEVVAEGNKLRLDFQITDGGELTAMASRWRHRSR